MYRLTHIDSGFEWSFATLAEAIEYLETFERQEEFEIRRQTARSIFLIIKRTYVRLRPGRSSPGPAQETHGCVYGSEKKLKSLKKLLTGHCIYDNITLSDRGEPKGGRL